MAFKKGQSGNPSGKPVDHKFLAALNRAIAQDDGKRLRKSAEALLNLAADGEAWAVRELADRLDGKPSQTLQGPNGSGVFDLGLPWLKKEIADRNQ